MTGSRFDIEPVPGTSPAMVTPPVDPGLHETFVDPIDGLSTWDFKTILLSDLFLKVVVSADAFCQFYKFDNEFNRGHVFCEVIGIVAEPSLHSISTSSPRKRSRQLYFRCETLIHSLTGRSDLSNNVLHKVILNY